MTFKNSINGHREADASDMSEHPRSLRDVCADLNKRVSAFLAAQPENERVSGAQEQTRVAISVISKALKDYEFDALSLSYNGGKDCLVLLIIYLSTIYTHFKSFPSSSFPTTIPSIYAKPPDPFPAVTTFVERSSKDYHLDLVHISTNPGPSKKSKSHSSPPPPATPTTTPTSNQDQDELESDEPIISFRDAFALYLDSHPSVRAIFVGTRRSDPHGAHLTHFDMTDGSWPRFMRIHPVIDWHLSEIWIFLRSPHLAPSPHSTVLNQNERDNSVLDYCTMYDEGYTSLGGVGDTIRNPKLRYEDEKGKERYRPAYVMTEDDGERLGRE